MFYDQGVGIPATLQEATYREFLQSVFSSWTDSEKIKAAMVIGRSSSEMPERGKGLQNLIEFAQTYSDGRLSIYSLQGMYQMLFKRVNGVHTERSLQKDFSTTVGGTLIEWRVKLG